jgi:hypothetical protein
MQVKIYVGNDTKTKWDEICEGYTSNTAAFVALVENYYWRHQMSDTEETEEDTMNVKQALLSIQYSKTWEVWARGLEDKDEARYVQPASQQTHLLEDQGWRKVADGEEIGDFVRDYCDSVPDEDREEFAEEACTQFLEELRES